MVQKPLRHVPQGFIDLHLQRVADAPRVVRALPQQRPDDEVPILERGPPEEGVEVEEVVRAARSHQLGQVHLVEAVELVGRVLVVESPESPVRQDAPLHPCVLDVERDLVARILFEQASRLPPLSETSSGLPQYLASAIAKALPLSSSSVSVFPLFAATERASSYST